MQDPERFLRQRALAAFHRRRLYPILSEDWWHTVDEARRFVNTYRALQATRNWTLWPRNNPQKNRVHKTSRPCAGTTGLRHVQV